jgi:hypothetical protein
MNKLIKPPSATEMAGFIDELCEEEVHVLGCGGGTVTELANSDGWLRWIHGKRNLLRLAVYLLLSSARQTSDMEEVPGRADDILFRYGDRRLLRELLELRDTWAKHPAIPFGVASEDQARKSSRLDELIAQISHRLR